MEQKFNTVDEVVEDIISEFTLAERVVAADLDETEFRVLELALGNYIQYRLDKMDATVNKKLMKDCLEKAGDSLDEVDAASVILRELMEKLRETHRLRVVK